MGNRTEAYDFALFEERAAAVGQPYAGAQPQHRPEEQPQQGGRVVELPQQGKEKEPQARPKRHPLRFVMASVCFAVIFATVCAAVQSQVVLTELTQEINTATADLNEAKSLEIQLQMQAALRMNDAQVEEYAANKLGMSKISGTQVVYVNVAREDQGQILQDLDGGSLLDKMLASLQKMFA